MSALFYFNDILTIPDLPQNNIYRLLALNGCSQIYAEQGEDEKADRLRQQHLSALLRHDRRRRACRSESYRKKYGYRRTDAGSFRRNN